MNMDLEITFRQLESKGTNRRTATTKKMAAQLCKKAGFDKWTTRFLAKVAAIFGSVRVNEDRTQRAREVLDWLSRNEEALCKKLTWTKHNLHMAEAIIRLASDLSEDLKDFSPTQKVEIKELAHILLFVEKIAKHTTIWRQHNTKASLRSVGKIHSPKEAETEWSAASSLKGIKQDGALYEALPRQFRKQLERTAVTKRAA